MGLADMLIKMRIRYGSEDAIILCDSIGEALINRAAYASCCLAAREDPFPQYKWKYTQKSEFFQTQLMPTVQEAIRDYGLRNSQLLTCAPTGTLSTMLGISGGLEPIFSYSYTRKTESLYDKEKLFKVYTPIVAEYMQTNNITDEKDLPDYFVTAHELNYHERISMQATLQKYIDASISSTINLPEETTIEDVMNIYYEGWKKGLKGVTIFRNNCKRAGVLTATEESKKDNSNGNKINAVIDTPTPALESHSLKRGEILKCDDNLVGKRRTLTVGCGHIHLQAFYQKGTNNLVETFCEKGSTGGCERSLNGLSRMISLSLRGGIPLEDILDQLNSVAPCPAYIKRRATQGDTSPGYCCPVAIARALKEMTDEMAEENKLASNATATVIEKIITPPTKVILEPQPPISANPLLDDEMRCPICGSIMIASGACFMCEQCGESKCG